MYLARVRIDGELRFIIRESRPTREGSAYLSRDLVDLGPDPSIYIRYPVRHVFTIAPEVTEQLKKKQVTLAPGELEKLFWPFVKPEVRRFMDPIRDRGRKGSAPFTAADQEAVRRLHPFDKRRQHFLRFGNINQGPPHRMPSRIFRKLLHKSRDQLEQYFLEAECILRPREIKFYVYTIFDLQKFFGSDLARRMPQVIDQEEMDERFLTEYCKLQDDPAFWAGVGQDSRQPEYLGRYVVMFFDNEFGPGSYLNEYFRSFIHSHRQFRPPPPAATITRDEAAAIFDEKPEVLEGMSARELTRLFRKRALRLHPDKGGEQEAFVRLTEAYNELLRRKRSKR